MSTCAPNKKTKQPVLSQREFFFGNHDLNYIYSFPTNFVRTAKYNAFNFFPKALLLQFKRYANIYFLIIAVLQSIPTISPLNPFSAIAPFLFVIALSMLREGLEDLARHRSDKESNSNKCTIYSEGKFVETEWHEIKVGDLILCKDMEILPADIVVISTSNENGTCFIETSSLDGEKNLKPKGAPKETIYYYDHAKKIVRLEGKIACMLPNPMLSSFDGTLTIFGNQKIIMNSKQLLLRGSKLKNTEWIVGIVTYTGGDTKIMKNSESSKTKQSQIEKTTNKLILKIFIFQLIICLGCSVGAFIYNNNVLPDYKNVAYARYSSGVEAGFAFFSYLLLNNTMIPISLIVTLEFVKLIQAYFINQDEDMYCEDNGRHGTVFTSAINEELGQVEYLFSDKTGTLTMNKMEFKIAVIGDEMYGDTSILKDCLDESGRPKSASKLDRKISYSDKKNGIDFSFSDKMLKRLLESGDGDKDVNMELWSSDQSWKIHNIHKQSDLVKEYFTALATCHECLVEHHPKGDITYQGPSPDEITLVDAANRIGFKCLTATQNLRKIKALGIHQEYEVLHAFEFNSDRKRMTVILKDNHNRIKLYIKGADSIIKSRLTYKAQQPFLKSIEKRLDDFSRKGLRTLLVGMKILDMQEYGKFLNKFLLIADSDNKEKEIDKLADEIERDLYLIGATAVEDRLQENVPETIYDLLQANIKVWMLTGDKLETAENIAKSCNLIQDGFQVLRCSETNKKEIQDVLVKNRKHYDYFVQQNIKKAMVVEGESLGIIFHDDVLKSLFLSITKGCDAVVCCRVTPKQKAEVVRLVKQGLGKITLAIGDGANDVNMIQEAHIGIGIYGQEGMRAVQASDFALPEFQGLWRLLFVHGRWSYLRISEMILYFFYKNMIFTVPQFYFAFVCAFSARSVFDDFYITLYNLIFTALPLLVRAVLEQDVNYKSLSSKDGEVQTRPLIKKHFPKLYYVGQKNKIFTEKKFLKSVLHGLMHGLLLFLVTMFVIDKTILTADGDTADFWYFSITLYTSVIFVVDVKLAIKTKYWTLLNFLAITGTSLAIYIAYVWVSNMLPNLLLYQTALKLFTSNNFYLIIMLNVAVVFLFDMIYMYMKARYYTTLIIYFRSVIKQGNANLVNHFRFLNSLRTQKIENEHDETKKALKQDVSDMTVKNGLKTPQQNYELSELKSRDEKDELELQIEADTYLRAQGGDSFIGNISGTPSKISQKDIKFGQF